MKLIFWTKTPFLSSLRKAFLDALYFGFCSPKRNSSFAKELIKYIFDYQIFIRTAIKELQINLSNNIISRRAKFRRTLNEQQNLFGKGAKSIDVAEIILNMLCTESLLKGNVDDLKKILVEGNPTIIVANHPFAPIDGLLIMNLVHKYRKDYFQLVNGNNGIVSLCPEFNYRLIPVDMSEGALRTSDPIKAKISRTKAFRQSFNNLYKCGQCLILFPAGNISKALKWGDPIQDSQWLSGVGLLVKMFSDSQKELNILPIFIDTHMGSPEKSYNYQLAFLNNPIKVSATLMDAFFNPPKLITLHIGASFLSSGFKGKSKVQISDELRDYVYSMINQLPIADKSFYQNRKLSKLI